MLSILLGISTSVSIESEDLRKHVYFLASDFTEGRLSGTKGNTIARDYLKFYLRKLGYEVQEQSFPIKGKVVVESFRVEPEMEAYPLYFTSSGRIQGRIGKEISIVDAREFTEFDMIMKAMDMKNQGKKAVVFVVDKPVRQKAFFRDDIGIVAIQVPSKEGEKLKQLKSMRIDISVRKEDVQGVNILAFKKGRTGRYIFVGAHYDHLGYGPMNSMQPDTIEIHNGADDNASGVAGVLELAEYFANRNNEDNLVFAFWDAEELGLIGSEYFVEHPIIPLESLKIYVNLDMIGRLRDNKLYIIGSGSAKELKEVLLEINNRYGFKLELSESGFGASDQNAFYNRNIPVLHFFTGAHEDYHKPSDDAHKLNYDGQANVVRFVRDLVLKLDGFPKLSFKKVKKEMRVSRTRLKVRLGIIPDYAGSEGGLRIVGTVKDSPADKAGLSKGDIIVRIGKYEVKNIYDLMYALTKYEPGDVVEIHFLRDGKLMKSKTRLEKARRWH